jgi:hypothetical protein
MAAEQLPASQYTVGGQVTAAKYQVISSSYGIEEDTESKKNGAGQHRCDITYSRRQTLSITVELEDDAVATLWTTGGSIAADATINFKLADGSTASAWEIRSVSRVNTRGPVQIQLELVSTTDLITA